MHAFATSRHNHFMCCSLHPCYQPRAAGVHGVNSIQAMTHPATPHPRAQVPNKVFDTVVSTKWANIYLSNKRTSIHAPPKIYSFAAFTSCTRGSLWHGRRKKGKSKKTTKTESGATSCLPSSVNIHHVRIPPRFIPIPKPDA